MLKNCKFKILKTTQQWSHRTVYETCNDRKSLQYLICFFFI
uniref:Uncharacterized protein n=1 Tax=Rhizophora mucronata TaxID=61149 RepID=A0A2P2Q5E9_RHIMU